MKKTSTAHAPNVDSTKKLQANFSTSNAAQRERILDWLCSESLTTLQARKELDVLHPAGRIKELRSEGFNIATHWTIEDTAKGRHRVARYVY